jgi:hypothetical protein
MSNPMTKNDSSRIQSTQVRYITLHSYHRAYCLQARGGHDMSSSGFAARAQSAGDRHTNTGNQGSNNAANSGGNQNQGGAKK